MGGVLTKMAAKLFLMARRAIMMISKKNSPVMTCSYTSAHNCTKTTFPEHTDAEIFVLLHAQEPAVQNTSEHGMILEGQCQYHAVSSTEMAAALRAQW
jgi:hypothetical protein